MIHTRRRKPSDLTVPARILDSTPEELEWALFTSVVFVCPSGYTLMREGDIGADVYFLLQGTASVREKKWWFFYREVGSLKAGDIFGEIGYLVKGRRTASVVTRGPCEVLRVVAHEFTEYLEKRPDVKSKLEMTAVQRMWDHKNRFQSAKEPRPEPPPKKKSGPIEATVVTELPAGLKDATVEESETDSTGNDPAKD